LNEFSFIEIAVPLLASLWIFRELWGLFLRRSAAPEAPASLPAQPVDRTDYLIAVAVAVGFYLLALWRLGTPDKQFFDEIYHARSGMEYALGLDPHEWTHPPLAKLIIAGSLMAWRADFNPRDGAWAEHFHYLPHQAFAWRYPSVLFGCGALVLLYILARSLFRNRAVATIAPLILACDGVFFVQSRMAMTNTFTVFFVLLSVNGTWRFIRREGGGDYRWLLLTGLGLGLALATRWSTLWSWGMTGLALLWHVGTTLWPRWTAEGRGVALPLLKWAAWVILTMGIIPVALYAASYIPFVLQAPGGDGWASKIFAVNAQGHGWERVWTLQRDMWNYHAGIKEKHPYSSPWWSWPLMVRPTWYYFDRDARGLVSGVWAIGNAAIWWATLPAMATLAVLAWREQRLELGLIVLFGLGHWLPWGIEPRQLIFMHYFYESIPYACLALAYLGCRLWYSGDEGRRTFASCYAVLIVGWFVFYYPLLSAYPIRERYYEMHLWLGRPWI
jgi:dolichyl-phosphate-mannose--protein O-mannosyl transferase